MPLAKTIYVLALTFTLSIAAHGQLEEMDLYASDLESEVLDLGELEPWRSSLFESSCLTGKEKALAISFFERLGFVDWHQLQSIPDIDITAVRCMITSQKQGRSLRYRKEWDDKTRLNYIYRSGSDLRDGYHLLKVKSALTSKLRAGLLLERDRGEKYWHHNGPPYWGGYLEWNSLSSHIKRLILGDYKVCFGQGLIFNNHFRRGLVHGLGQLPVIDHANILPFQGVDENRGLRGIGMKLGTGSIQSCVFLSSRHQDASINPVDEGIRSLQYAGLHITESSISNRDRLWVNLGGIGLTWKNDLGQVSLNQIVHHQNQAWTSHSEIRKKPGSFGTSFYASSFSHRLELGALYLYGELAYQPGRSPAFTQGLIWDAGTKHHWSILIRHLPKDYIAQYTQGLFRSAFRNNENGVFFGYVFQPSRVYEFSVNFDHSSQPWWSFHSGPGRNSDQLTLRVHRNIRKRSSQSLRVHYKSDRLSNGTINRSLRVRSHFIWKPTKGLEWRMRSEYGWTAIGDQLEHSWLHYQEVKWSELERPWQGLIRLTFYQSSSYDGRIYAYEHRLAGNFLIPGYYGKGIECYLLFKYRFGPMRVSSRLGIRNRMTDNLDISRSMSLSLQWVF